MGTRGAIGFRLNGTDRITYNHFDSYPEGLGFEMLAFAQETSENDMVLAALWMTPTNGEPTAIDRHRYAKFANGAVSTGDDWYSLLRGAQGTLRHYVTGELLHYEDAADFLADSLFCEWAYIVNLDDHTLEVYRGFNKNPQAAGRYAHLHREREGEYFGVALHVALPLHLLKTLDADKFLTIINMLGGDAE